METTDVSVGPGRAPIVATHLISVYSDCRSRGQRRNGRETSDQRRRWQQGCVRFLSRRDIGVLWCLGQGEGDDDDDDNGDDLGGRPAINFPGLLLPSLHHTCITSFQVMDGAVRRRRRSDLRALTRLGAHYSPSSRLEREQELLLLLRSTKVIVVGVVGAKRKPVELVDSAFFP